MSRAATDMLIQEWIQEIPSSAFKLALVLADRLNNGSGQLNPGQQTLAEQVGCSERTIRRQVEELKQLGFLRYRRTLRTAQYELFRRDGTPIRDDQGWPIVDTTDKNVRSGADNSDRSERTTLTGPERTPGVRSIEPGRVNRGEEPKDADASDESRMSDKAFVWRVGPRILGASHKGTIGKQVRDHGESAVRRALEATRVAEPAVPVEYFIGCLRGHDAMEEYLQNPLAGIRT